MAEKEVNPTCVGMNRSRKFPLPENKCKPHVRGDEPYVSCTEFGKKTVNPTCVGMNRPVGEGLSPFNSKPHVRGDEPAKNGAVKLSAK